MQRSSRTQNTHQETEWVFVYFENKVVSEMWSLTKNLSSLTIRVIQLPCSAIFFLFQLFNVFSTVYQKYASYFQNYCLNFHQVKFSNDITCIILQRFNVKMQKTLLYNFHAFPKTCYFHPRVWAVGTEKYLKVYCQKL